MAETQGVDLTRAMGQGKLQAEEWRDAVVGCTGCSDPEACLSWLAEYAATEWAGAPVVAGGAPDFCVNRALIAWLAAEVAAPEAGVAAGGAAPAADGTCEEVA